MKAASSNVTTSVAFHCVVLLWVFSPSLTTAWSTCTCYSFSRSTRQRRSIMQLHRRQHSTDNRVVVVTESSSENPTVNRQSSSAASTKTNRSKHTLHLLSLPPTDNAFTQPGEFLVRECWKWKDSVLGDGRDYFIPRPRSLKAFHAFFVGMIIDVTALAGIVDVKLTLPMQSSEDKQSDIRLRIPFEIYSNVVSMHDSPFQSFAENSFSERFAIEECVVLSNCARLDILLVLKKIRETGTEAPTFSPSRPEMSVADNLDSRMQNTTAIADIAARYAVAYILHHQINARRSKGTTLLKRTGLSSWLDLPGLIQTSTATSSITRDQSMCINQLGQRLISIEDPQAISTHLCLVACGLAPRTNRPDREVIFRPYSSRDAHIMLQLKRTAEVISVGCGRGRLKTVIDGALSAGKAARNEKKVPEIKKLKAYGSDGTPPSALAKEVANAAIEKAVAESVAICVSRLAAMDTNAVENISQLRQRVNEVVASLCHCRGGNLQKMANKLLHNPTMQLRQGILSGDDIEDVVMMIEKELVSQLSGIDL